MILDFILFFYIIRRNAQISISKVPILSALEQIANRFMRILFYTINIGYIFNADRSEFVMPGWTLDGLPTEGFDGN